MLRKTVKMLIEEADIIAELEVFDLLTSNNSVISKDKKFPSEIVDTYAKRQAKIIKLYFSKEELALNEIIIITEPLAVDKDNAVYDLDVYPYHVSLTKGQIVTVVLKQIVNGQFGIDAVGTAQINDKLNSEYNGLLDIVLNLQEPKNIELNNFNRAIICYEGMDFLGSMQYLVLKTNNKEYDVSYHCLANTSETYLEILGVGCYLIPGYLLNN